MSSVIDASAVVAWAFPGAISGFSGARFHAGFVAQFVKNSQILATRQRSVMRAPLEEEEEEGKKKRREGRYSLK